MAAERGGVGAASALVSAALFLPLAFQDIRLEGYESEKAGLLWLLAAPLLLLLPALWRRSWMRRGLVWLALIWAGSGLLSLLVSISPDTSLTGLIGRGQGWLTYAASLMLFFGAAAAARHLRATLTPVLVVVSVPICLYLIYQRFDVGIERPASLLGNANFLASWLILAFLLLLTDSRRFWGQPAFIVVVTALLLNAAALLLTGSRGALLALGGGLAAMGLAWCAVTARRRLAAGMIGALALGGLAYLTVTVVLPESGLTDTLRLFRPIDLFRIDAWGAGWRLLAEIGAPLPDAFGRSDTYAALRPLIGYGVDITPFLQARFGIVTSLAYAIDTFHNLAFDALTWTGLLGLAAWLAVYLAGSYAVLARLRLMGRRRDWLLAHLVGIMAGAAGMGALLAGRFLDAPPPLIVGAMLGLPLGTLIHLGGRALAARERIPADPLYLGILGVIVAHWIDLQFGFSTIAVGVLWWICLGVLVSAEQAGAETQAPVWGRAALAAGAVLIAGIGVTMSSQYIQHEVGTGTLPYLLAALLLIAVLGAERRILVGVIALVGVWGALAALESGLIRMIGADVDARLADASAPFANALLPLALKGTVAFIVAVVVWLRPRRRHLPVLIVAAGGVAVGAAGYALALRESVALAIATVYADSPAPQAQALALRLYGELDTPDARFAALRIAPLDGAAGALLNAEPYWSGRRDWAIFYDSYVDAYQRPPDYGLNVMRNGTFVSGFSRWMAWADADVRETRGRGRVVETGATPDLRGAIFQRTGVRVEEQTVFTLSVEVTNPTDQAQTVQVFIYPPDWSEPMLCEWMLEPGALLHGQMTAGAQTAWEEARVGIYLAEGGELGVDNVVMRLTPHGAPTETVCLQAASSNSN